MNFRSRQFLFSRSMIFFFIQKYAIFALLPFWKRYHNKNHQMSQVIKLDYSIPEKSDLLGFSAGLRPYREGGIRMQKQKIVNGKTLYHHYGHGGGGLSLAYGCCLHVIDNLFLKDLGDKPSTVAVLGAGIIGLTTAYILIQRGFNVTVYAQLVPFDRTEHKPQITTTVAAGYWMPLKVGNKDQTRSYAVNTWKHYAEIQSLQKKLNRPLGIQLMPTYAINDDEGLTYMEIEGVIKPEECKVTFGDGKVHEALTFPTYIIESEKYLPYIMEVMEKSGKFKLIRKHFDTYQDIVTLKEHHIFTCLGMGSAFILPDEHHMKGIKGHVLKFKLDQKSADYTLFMKHNKEWILVVPHRQSGKLCIGISYEDYKLNPYPEIQMVEKVFKSYKNFFEEVQKGQLKPKL